MFLSVIIPTYNPNINRLKQTLNGLKLQTLPPHLWELIIIDNNSSIPFEDKIDLGWHPNSQIVIEPRQGLTYARLKGFTVAKGDIIVMIDDDNIPGINYLSQTGEVFEGNKQLGAIGGKSVPLFETTPPAWLKEFYTNLALRDMGENVIIDTWQNSYPEAAPIGAGMTIKKDAVLSYIAKTSISENIISDRKGDSLSSGGDNDMIIEILRSGWHVGYFPGLVIQHIIPKERMQAKYLARLINNTNKSWIQLLESHHINPWNKIPAWSVPLRKIKAWFVYCAWKNEVQYIKWQGACGTFDGLAEINEH